MRYVVNGGMGRMGRLVVERLLELGHDVVVVDPKAQVGTGEGIEGVRELSEVGGTIHGIFDFSTPQGALEALKGARDRRVPVLIGTTGLDEGVLEAAKESSKHVAVLIAPNTSVGIAVLRRVVRIAAQVLSSGYDIEILEAHHRYKKDAPSGTARLIAQELETLLNRKVVTSREEAREEEEIGVFSLRGGNVVGTHTVYFLGDMDQLELTHRALDRRVFARGAVMLMERLQGKGPGLYGVDEILF